MNGPPPNGNGQHPTPPDPSKPHAPAQYGKPTSLRQVVDLQSAMHEAALLLKDDAKTAVSPASRARASLALGALGQSWVRLQDAKRVILGRPGPGNLRPEAAPKGRRANPKPAAMLDPEETGAGPGNVPRGTIALKPMPRDHHQKPSSDDQKPDGESAKVGTPMTPAAHEVGTQPTTGDQGGPKGISFGVETVGAPPGGGGQSARGA
jgi:hypothetical protein